MSLRIGVLSTWHTRCGIAEYTGHLVNALNHQEGIELTVFGSRNFGDRAVASYEDWAVPVFDVQIWHPEHSFELDVEAILGHQLDVLLIQFSTLFFDHGRMVELLRRFPGVTAVTYHDKEGVLAFPCELVDLLYAHRKDVGIGPRHLIPQGIDLRAPVVKTFGLGKSRLDVIGEICARNRWDFQHSFGKDRWLEHDELFAWLRDCDAIVLWYDKKLGSGGSAAAPFAIGTRRPVFVNDTHAFADLPERASNLRKLRTPTELEVALTELFANPYAEERTWERVAATMVADFREAIADGRGGASSRHSRILRERAFVALDHKPLRGVLRRARAYAESTAGEHPSFRLRSRRAHPARRAQYQLGRPSSR